MTRMLRALAVSGAMLLAAGTALAQPVTHGGLTIRDLWVRATPPGAPTAAGYFSVSNGGTVADRLVGASSPDAASVEVHEMSMSGGVMRMRPVAGGIAIAPGRTVTLAPGGYHLMFIGPKRQFKAGGSVPVTLDFARAGKVRLVFPVRPTVDTAVERMPGMGKKP